MARAPMVEDDCETEEIKQAAADVLYHYSQVVMVCSGEGVRPTDLRLHLMKVSTSLLNVELMYEWDFVRELSRMLSSLKKKPFLASLSPNSIGASSSGSESATLIVPCLPTEGSILLQLKRELSNSNLVSWQHGTDCCRWEGVACDPVSARVTFLDLSSRGISGKIVSTSALFNLTSLHYLNLAWNQFDPITLPASGFERLSNLTHLNLSNAGFIGQVPIGIAHLTNLISLDLSISYFTPDTSDQLILHDPSLRTLIGNLSNMRELYLDGSFISSVGSDWCRALSVSVPLLQVLSLPGCSLSGPIDPSLTRLSSLTTIDLRYNNFSSAVPESFANFSSLSSLQLASCGLEGLFPQEVFQLKNLTLLDVSNNPMLFGNLPNFHLHNSLEILMLGGTRFSGAIPNSIGRLKSLTTLNVSGCSFWGPVPSPIFTLTQLHYLDLSSNNFNGTVELGSFWSLRNLSHLSLSNNKLTVIDGEYNYSSASSPQISSLYLASCNLTKFPAALMYLPNLTDLDLSSNQIHGAIPLWIWEIGQNNLTRLILSHNMLTNVERSLSILPLPYIEILDLSYNMLDGPVPLPQGRYQVVLDYSNNRFSSVPLNISSYLRSTFFLQLSRNHLIGNIPTSICEALFLEVLDLSYNRFTGLIPSCLIEGNGLLRVLNLRGNRLLRGTTLPNNISRECPLRTLILNSNGIEGPLPKSLANCSMLEVLDLGNNRIVDRFPFWLGNLSMLQVLILGSNKFYGSVELPPQGERSDYHFPSLRILDLSSNIFIGNLSWSLFENLTAMMVTSSADMEVLEFNYVVFPSYSDFDVAPYLDTVVVIDKGQDVTLAKILTAFTMIDLSSNQFHGAIPEVIGNLRSLRGLNMSHNAFTGGIPSGFGGLAQLESLDLSSNRLSGEIPESLTSLTFLELLNLSYNSLVGRIPQGNQFFAFPNSSFEGNVGLCGRPLSKQCNTDSSSTSPAPVSPSSTSKHRAWKHRVETILLFLFVGLGFGVGFASVIVFQVVCRSGRIWLNKLFIRR
ncbi:Receptor-like protein 12 [Ananas comosus]|uniref:Receptor-like protein 12 n=1 Tax=Ananas comosus TaxID=4615 RepID=A0A199UL52_ANACO|nr:Receptor-like protein 12 [Ananas comosus]